jgi:hypothetical protein
MITASELSAYQSQWWVIIVNSRGFKPHVGHHLLAFSRTRSLMQSSLVTPIYQHKPFQLGGGLSQACPGVEPESPALNLNGR